VLASPGELASYRMTPKAVGVAERGLRMAADASSPPWPRPLTPTVE
jgi:hypothetical protein